MIVLPKRSVTRFFIPLIDVLTLLFCIFLVMPLAQNAESKGDGDHGAMAERIRLLEEQLAQIRAQGGDPRKLKEEIDRLRQQLGRSIKERVSVRVLEIDGDKGQLFYRKQAPNGEVMRVEIKTRADADRLIEQDRRELGLGQREMYYLILYPRDRKSSYPTVRQYEDYQKWFEGVALGFDIPGEAPEGGARP
jgi:hypothetical protein